MLDIIDQLEKSEVRYDFHPDETHCRGKHEHNVIGTPRVYDWKYRPRYHELDNGAVPDDDAKLIVILCDSCYKKYKHKTPLGWDFWDAIDGLFDDPDFEWYLEMARERSKIIYQELLQKALHPSRVGKHLQYHLEQGGTIDDFTI